ncbi:hypothetical protein IAR50_004651 [Cryptococcus sp. DSM 104548]
MSTKYPARAHALKLIHELVPLIPETQKGKLHGIFLQGAPTLYRDDTDHEEPFHQEANFNYLSGMIHPSCSLVILFSLANTTSKSVIEHHLFIPAADPAETMWSVAPPTLEEARKTYDSDDITYTSSLPSVLRNAVSHGAGEVILHVLPRTTAYPALPEIIEQTPGLVLEQEFLFPALHAVRLTKDECEISLIRKANQISSGAHEVVMRELGRFAQSRIAGSNGKEVVTRSGKEGIREWEIESERDAEAVFVASCKRMGATDQAYLPIVASGSRASTLHYVCNDRLFPAFPRKQGDVSFSHTISRGCCGDNLNSLESALHGDAFFPQLLLIDAGCEWKGYASDITRVMPVGNGGKFTKEGGAIYELVLRMQKECEALVKPGVHWDSIHLHAHKVLIDGLLSFGILAGSPEAILQSGITAAFFPHGLGHSIGLDTHDSLQYLRSARVALPPTSSTTPDKLYKYLRLRLPLMENMVVTVEPGCYFAPQLLKEHGVWESEYVDKSVLEAYLDIGGVRIEDVVVVRQTGVENLTTVGKEREWVEGVCSGAL